MQMPRTTSLGTFFSSGIEKKKIDFALCHSNTGNSGCVQGIKTNCAPTERIYSWFTKQYLPYAEFTMLLGKAKENIRA